MNVLFNGQDQLRAANVLLTAQIESLTAEVAALKTGAGSGAGDATNSRITDLSAQNTALQARLADLQSQQESWKAAFQTRLNESEASKAALAEALKASAARVDQLSQQMTALQMQMADLAANASVSVEQRIAALEKACAHAESG
jgi:chromosome segregation ATPase